MGPLAISSTAKYTYKDYLTWDDDERWELISGQLYNMTPAPSRRHQKLSGELFRQFANFLFGKTCEVYDAPFDVRLPEPGESDDDAQNVVQPDLVVICDPSKLDDHGCKGSPDLVVEILSPSTSRKDLKEKFLLYERAGVKEYWVVDPVAKTVMAFRQYIDSRFGRPDVYSEEDKAPVGVLEGLTIDLGLVFKE
jgi:Uma2 family endonuclease